MRIKMRKMDQKGSGGVCKVVVSCAVLHNLLVLAKDTHTVRGDGPHIGRAPTRNPDDDSDSEEVVTREQGAAKRDDTADILVSSI
ncbi:unnamed protein product [Phytophthora fragariaefolia]|uniref:Unnamed protein product n=1 Tax=Phytophthora fragariaefolia TaxID=1490495 RepID=A0A9W6XDM1_9STRA|nr:unnamed protein product [Phytophthora fragariaefolia]